MTSAINDLTTLVLREDRLDIVRETVDIVALLVLIVVIAQAELRRAYAGRVADASQRVFSTAIRPLLLVFVAVVVGRMLEIR